MQIRQLTEDDILSVLAVQREAYLPQLIEAAEIFLNKLRLFPQGAIGYFVDGRLCAYIFSHPWIKSPSMVPGIGNSVLAWKKIRSMGGKENTVVPLPDPEISITGH